MTESAVVVTDDLKTEMDVWVMAKIAAEVIGIGLVILVVILAACRFFTKRSNSLITDEELNLIEAFQAENVLPADVENVYQEFSQEERAILAARKRLEKRTAYLESKLTQAIQTNHRAVISGLVDDLLILRDQLDVVMAAE